MVGPMYHSGNRESKKFKRHFIYETGRKDGVVQWAGYCSEPGLRAIQFEEIELPRDIRFLWDCTRKGQSGRKAPSREGGGRCASNSMVRVRRPRVPQENHGPPAGGGGSKKECRRKGNPGGTNPRSRSS